MAKKILFILLIMPLMVFAEPIEKDSNYVSQEEIQTVKKLHHLGVLEKPRTTHDLNQPLTAKDTFSLTIKAMKAMSEMDSERWSEINSRYAKGMYQIYDWQEEVEGKVQHQDRVLAEMKELKNKNTILFNSTLILTAITFVAAIL